MAQPGGRYVRTYPSGSLAAHVTGYFSVRYGRSGIEAAMNSTLAGTADQTTFAGVLDQALGRPVAGNDVVLTIDSRIQRAAEKAIAGRKGAVVVLDPRTGAVLALASSPTFQPALVDSDWATYSKSSSAPLVDRALSSLYPPGSTFKIVTLTRVISSGIAGPDTVLPAPPVLTIGGGKVTNFEGEGGGSATLRRATASSINTVFAPLGVQMGAAALVDQADRYGFDRPVPFALPVVPSLMPAPSRMTTWETAWAAVGQPVGAALVKGPVATAMQMALVGAGVANNGVVMRPYIVARTMDPSGGLLTTATPQAWTTATDTQTAATVRDLMREVVLSGSGTRAALPGVAVAGKTGTAEVGKTVLPDAWFVAFAPAATGQTPSVAVSIVIENGGVGGVVAAPRARSVLAAALGR